MVREMHEARRKLPRIRVSDIAEGGSQDNPCEPAGIELICICAAKAA